MAATLGPNQNGAAVNGTHRGSMEKDMAKIETTSTTATNNDSLAGVSAGRKREFLAFLKSLRNIGSDLSNFASGAPPFVLAPVSMVEYPAYLAERSDLFLAPLKEKTPADRAKAVVLWFLGVLGGQQGRTFGVDVSEEAVDVRPRKEGPGEKRGKKPLNPILGEVFRGWFEVEGGQKIEIVSEQVSHHPPVAAFRISYTNAKNGTGIKVEGYQQTRSRFQGGTIRIERPGPILVTLNLSKDVDETFLLEIPRMHLAGLIPAMAPYPEFEGTYKVISSTGYVADIEFKGKGFFGGGNKNDVKVALINVQDKSTVYKMDGQWANGEIRVTNSSGQTVQKSESSGPQQSWEPLHVPAPADEKLWNSRKIWREVAKAIGRGDMASVVREKQTIEEEQRALRKQEAAEGSKWQTRHFQSVDEWPSVNRLLMLVGQVPETNPATGIWRWHEKE